MIFLAVGIPFFFLFILGLKILVDNLKSTGKVVNLTLLAVWLIAVFSLISIGVMQAMERSNEGNVINTHELNIKANDTLYLAMKSNTQFGNDVIKRGGFSLKYDENDNQVIYSNNIRLIVRSTNDSLASLLIDRKAYGKEYLEAKNRAEAIEYNYVFNQNSLTLDGYFLADVEDKYRDQEIEITLYLPVGSVLNADSNTYSFHRNTSSYRDILNNGQEGYYLEIQDGKTACLDCPAKTTDSNDDFEYNSIDWDDENWQETWKDGNKIKIDRDGIDINITDEKDSVRVMLNKKGIKVKSN